MNVRIVSRSRRATSLTEVMIACAIMAAALVPIVAIISGSHRQIAAEKAEAVVSSWATTKFHEYVFVTPYDDVVDASGEEEIDGVTIRWELHVAEVDPLTVTFQSVRYHEPCDDGEEAGDIEEGDLEAGVPVAEVDRKFDGSVLKTLVLNIEWRPFNQGWDEHDPRKTLTLVTRKARLE